MFIQQLSHVGVEAKLLHRGNVHVDLHTHQTGLSQGIQGKQSRTTRSLIYTGSVRSSRSMVNYHCLQGNIEISTL